MRFAVAMLAVMLAATPALANGNGNGNGGGSIHHNNVQIQGGTDTTVDAKAHVTVEGDSYKRQAPSATAPSLAAEACMGSTSFGASSPFGGLAFGTTWKNDECQVRKNAWMLRAFGHPEAALTLLSTNPGVAEALRLNSVPFVAFDREDKHLETADIESGYGTDFEEVDDEYSITE